MCQTVVYKHTSECDVRTLVISPDSCDRGEAVVDPRAEPKPCHCKYKGHIAPWLRCKWHNCCFLHAQVTRIPDCLCNDKFVLHKYEPRRHPDTYNTPEDRAQVKPRKEGWHPLPMLDQNLLDNPALLVREHWMYRRYRTLLSVIGARIYDLLSTLIDAHREFCEHTQCRNSLEDWEWDWLERNLAPVIRARWLEASFAWEVANLDVFSAFRDTVKMLDAMQKQDIGSGSGLEYLMKEPGKEPGLFTGLSDQAAKPITARLASLECTYY